MTTPNPRTLLTGTTPGPWEAQEQDPQMDGRNVVFRQKGVPGLRASIHFYGHNNDPELIAAAPDLAARVIALEDGIRALWLHASERDYPIHVNWLAHIHYRDALRALLDGDTTTPVGDTNTTPKETK